MILFVIFVVNLICYYWNYYFRTFNGIICFSTCYDREPLWSLVLVQEVMVRVLL